MNFQKKLNNIITKNNSLVCVGLDSDINKLPEVVKNKPNPQFKFNKAIIDATCDLVCAYKPNSAFYEARGRQGLAELKMTIDYLKTAYPEIVTILDAKRADIGSTNEGYVSSIFDYYGFDAITLHPYLGREALQPFLAKADKGCIILCRTSNPGAGEFQDLSVEGQPLYKYVARQVAEKWNFNNNCLLVLGATYPEELGQVREMVGDLNFLVPGIGAQGGDLESILRQGLNSQKAGLIINSARAIIFASTEPDFAKKSRQACLDLCNKINQYR